MASSNRHWPSMFKSKPCNAHHQWQHDINPPLMSSGCHRAPYSSVPVCEERSPEPKPRWNPKPEQIRILEAIFNSGMVNPPRDEIRKIRAQLQEYGQVGDANVFYWFQNRKSRSKHKLRNLQNSKQQSQQTSSAISGTVSATAPSPSSSSDKSSPDGSDNSNKNLTLSSPKFISASSSPTPSVSQTYYQPHNEFLTEPFFFPVQPAAGSGTGFTQVFGFSESELSNVVQVPDHESVGPCTSLLLSEIMNHHHNHHHGGSKNKEHEEKMKMPLQLSCTMTFDNVAPPLAAAGTSTVTVPSPINQIQDVGESSSGGVVGGPARSTVFINDVAFEVAVGPFNVREAFGDDAVLVNSSGLPVLTNEWGVTLQSLQHGAFYYLLRPINPFSA